MLYTLLPSALTPRRRLRSDKFVYLAVDHSAQYFIMNINSFQTQINAKNFERRNPLLERDQKLKNRYLDCLPFKTHSGRIFYSR